MRCKNAVVCRYAWPLLSVVVFLSGVLDSHAAEKLTLEESADDARSFSVDARVEVAGKLQTSAGEGKALSLDLSVDARLTYRERRLTGAGRDARAFRSVRDYQHAEAAIEVQQQKTFSRLSEVRSLFVAQGRRDGVEFYRLEGAMTPSELDLLRMPGDSLAVLGLLPPQPVEVGEKWSPDSWVAQMLTGTEAVLKSDLTCELTGVNEKIATVRFRGEVEGATLGAASEITLEGEFRYDLEAKHITQVTLIQTEKRSVGSVSPGMDVVANVTWKRKPAATSRAFDDDAMARVPLEPDAGQLRLRVRTPWNVQFHVDRDWHVFHQTADQTILRLLEGGSLIAQCNIARIASVEAGQHTPETEFQQDVARALGKQLKTIVKSERISTGDRRYIYRVVAAGEANGVDMQWIYYLCAAPDGRQASLVFAVEKALVERLGDRDRELVERIEFLTLEDVPTPAGP